MHKETIIYQGTRVHFRALKYRNLDNERTDMCPLCRKKIVPGDDLWLIMNNYILFPNMFVHRNCVGTKRTCISKLVRERAAFRKVVAKYKFWIDKYYAEG